MTQEIEFLLRWLHFLSGITWIGMLYYFNFVQTPFFKTCEASTRSEMIRGLVPNALWWFRWGAMFTFLTGVAIVMMKAHATSAAAAESGTTVNWWATSYATIILTGGLMGTLMWFNVWFIIWPAQKVVIASAEQVAGGGEAIADAAARGGRAGMASRTNTLFSIPMLFCMGGASHLQNLVSGAAVMNYWLVMGLIIIIVEFTGAFSGAGKPFQKHLTSVQGVITAGFVLTAVVYAGMKLLA